MPGEPENQFPLSLAARSTRARTRDGFQSVDNLPDVLQDALNLPGAAE